MKCKYGREKEVEYFDFTENEYISFECDEDAKEDGYCIFHHPTYWERNKDEVKNEFMKKIENAIKNQEKLICIGYNLPEVNLTGYTFETDVCFDDTIFHEKADFVYTEFSKGVSFANVKFKEVNFKHAIFREEAYFPFAEFSKEANFSYAEFYGETIFDDAKFLGMLVLIKQIFHLTY